MAQIWRRGWDLFFFSIQISCCYCIFCRKDYPFTFFFFLINLFIYFWLCWVFVSVRGLSLAAASGGHSSLQCAGLSLSWPLLLRSTGSRGADSAVVAHRPSCSAACGIFPYQGSNPCPLHWQADSQPLRHQGSPTPLLLNGFGLSWKSVAHKCVSLFLESVSLPLMIMSIFLSMPYCLDYSKSSNLLQ